MQCAALNKLLIYYIITGKCYMLQFPPPRDSPTQQQTINFLSEETFIPDHYWGLSALAHLGAKFLMESLVIKSTGHQFQIKTLISPSPLPLLRPPGSVKVVGSEVSKKPEDCR